MNCLGALCTLILMIAVAHPLGAQDCEPLRNADHSQMITYLRESSRFDSDAPCLQFAMKQLGDAHVRSAYLFWSAISITSVLSTRANETAFFCVRN